METCEEHDGCVVIFTSEECPLCSAIEQIDELKEEAETLNEEVAELEGNLEKIEGLEKIAEEETVTNN